MKNTALVVRTQMTNHFELFSLGLLIAATYGTYLGIQSLLRPSTAPTAIIVPTAMLFFVWLLIFVYTPGQSWTPVAFSGLLTISSVVGLCYDYEGLRLPIYVAGMTVTILPASLFLVFVLLAIKGVERREMGHMGNIADGIEQSIEGIVFFALVIADGCDKMVDRIRKKLRKILGMGGKLDIEVGAEACPPPYDTSISNFYCGKA